ncbi:MAG: GtrA family protein [Patescibacteria group bacterium]
MFDILENHLGIKSLIFRQFIVYGLVAIIPTIVDFSLVYSLTEFLNLYYVYSVVTAFIIASGVSYFVQKKITFKNKSHAYTPQYSVFIFVSLVSLFLNVVLISIMVEYLALWYLLAKAISQIIVSLWSFGANRFITFEKFQ